MADVQFLDELPSIRRGGSESDWVERLAPLKDAVNPETNRGTWGVVAVASSNPGNTVSMINGGKFAGLEADEYKASSRTLPEDVARSFIDQATVPGNEEHVEVTEDDVNDEGEVTLILARFNTEADLEAEAEAERKRAEAKAKREAKAAAKAEQG